MHGSACVVATLVPLPHPVPRSLQVVLAEVAAGELARVQRFLGHISHCAAKLQLGVNFGTNIPNLDRCVRGAAAQLMRM